MDDGDLHADQTATGRSQVSLADRSNWRTSPFSRWAFNNVDRLLPTAPIANDPEHVSELPRAPQSLDGFKLAFGGSTIDIKAFLTATATDAIVVLLDGKIAFESYANGATDRTPHILMSSTKAVIGLIVGILEQRGEVDTGMLVSTCVPEVSETAYKDATLRDLLDMRTGVVLDQQGQRDHWAAMNWDLPGAAPEGLHAFLSRLNVPARAHGGPFSYVSANTDLLGWAVERIMGRSIATLISDLLWKPMGAEQAAYITVDREGAPVCTGGLCATARDFARIGQLLIDHGRRGGTQVIPEALIDDLAVGGDGQAWAKGEWGEAFAPISRNMRYRSGWYAIDDHPKLLFAMGVHGQNLFVDRANKIVVAKLSSWSERTDHVALPMTHMAVPEIIRRLTAAA